MAFEQPDPHNACFKDLFSRPEFVQSFIENYIPEGIRSYLNLDTMDIDLSGFVSQEQREYYADVVVTVQLKDSPEFVSIYILFEHKSSPEFLARLQILNYMVQKWMDLKRKDMLGGRLPVVIPVVIYHGKGKWNYSLRFSDLFELPSEDFRPYVPEFKHMIHDISSMEDEEFRTSTLMEIFHLLFKYIYYPELETKLQEIYDLLETVPDQEKVKQYLQAIVQYVAVSGPISLEKLGEHTRRLPGGDEAMQTAAEQIRKEVEQNYEKEKPKWVEEGKKEGELKNAHETLIDVAGDLYGPLSNMLQAKIKSIQSIENLRTLTRKIHRTQSLDEFTELVNRAAES
ncbi:hypothetical protein AKJ60_01130 [candidate division MSBL1 archaeon SCGC-AAA385M11]|nr:hypothetical protein AKJ60_01130 [candidate division MSBL1 archaeon SCGC-AAA385M11]